MTTQYTNISIFRPSSGVEIDGVAFDGLDMSAMPAKYAYAYWRSISGHASIPNANGGYDTQNFTDYNQFTTTFAGPIAAWQAAATAKAQASPPYPFQVWSATTNSFVTDPVKYTAALTAALSSHRDTILYGSLVVSSTLTITASVRTRSALTTMISLGTVSIQFKTASGYVTLDQPTAKLALQAINVRDQVGFAAEKSVLDKHAATPYTDVKFTQPLADFETAFAAGIAAAAPSTTAASTSTQTGTLNAATVSAATSSTQTGTLNAGTTTASTSTTTGS